MQCKEGLCWEAECARNLWLDRTIWVIWIWAEIWMLLCDLTFWTLFSIYSVCTCDRSHVSDLLSPIF